MVGVTGPTAGVTGLMGMTAGAPADISGVMGLSGAGTLTAGLAAPTVGVTGLMGAPVGINGVMGLSTVAGAAWFGATTGLMGLMGKTGMAAATTGLVGLMGMIGTAAGPMEATGTTGIAGLGWRGAAGWIFGLMVGMIGMTPLAAALVGAARRMGMVVVGAIGLGLTGLTMGLVGLVGTIGGLGWRVGMTVAPAASGGLDIVAGLTSAFTGAGTVWPYVAKPVEAVLASGALGVAPGTVCPTADWL